MLNLLIAIMSDLTQRKLRGAALVARYERARLIVDLEPHITTSTSTLASGAHNMVLDRVAMLIRRTNRWVKRLLEFGIEEDPRPKWLHVLTNEARADDNDEGLGHSEIEIEREIATMRRTLSCLQNEVERISSRLCTDKHKQGSAFQLAQTH